MKKYIVCWMIKKEYIGKRYGNEKILEKDMYEVFIDGGSAENYDKARSKYLTLISQEVVYSANLCEIIESTDY